MSLIIKGTGGQRMISKGRKGGPKEMGDPLQKRQSDNTKRAPKQTETVDWGPRAKSEITTENATNKAGVYPSQTKGKYKGGPA